MLFFFINCIDCVILFLQSILKAYFRGVWDSVKGVSLIYIVIRDTCYNTPLENDSNNTPINGDSEIEDSSSSTYTTTTNTNRMHNRSNPNRQELTKLKEYVLNHLNIC